MRRRVGSARAAKVRSKLPVEYLTIWLSIGGKIQQSKLKIMRAPAEPTTALQLTRVFAPRRVDKVRCLQFAA
jgi:hypothetical protein